MLTLRPWLAAISVAAIALPLGSCGETSIYKQEQEEVEAWCRSLSADYETPFRCNVAMSDLTFGEYELVIYDGCSLYVTKPFYWVDGGSVQRYDWLGRCDGLRKKRTDLPR